MTTHELKIDPAYFAAIQSGEKTFEVRFNDLGYPKGDLLELRERRNGHYFTSRRFERRITYVHSGLGMKEGYVVLGLEKIND